MVTESRTLLHGERSCLKKKNATQIGMVLINVTKKVMYCQRNSNGDFPLLLIKQRLLRQYRA